MSGRWTSLGALVALCLAVYLPGLRSLPAVDRDESRFAQASRQMLESLTLPAASLDPVRHSGGWAVPMVQDKPRLNKPPLTYWLQAASAWVCTGGDVLRDDIWMYRIPSVLGAVLAVIATWRIGRSMFDPRVAWLGAAFLAVCPMVVWDAHQARADELLLGATTWAMAALWAICRRAWRGERVGWASPIGLWVAVAVGVLAKGPITPMVVVLSAVAASIALRRWRWISATRPLLGVAIVAAALAPWLAGVVRHVGWSAYLDTVWAEVIGRSAEAKEGHWGPPGYHLVLLAVLLWPGSLTTLNAFFAAWRRAGISRRAAACGRAQELFLLAWIVPSWIVFELVGTKLPHYTLPLYPAIALLSARVLLALTAQGREGIRRLGFGLFAWALIGLALVVGVPATLLGAERVLGLPWPDLAPVPMSVWLAPAISGLLLVGSLWVLRRSLVACCRMAMLAAASAWIGLMTLVLPGPRVWWNTDRLMRVIERTDPVGKRPLAAAGYQEDSLIFATRGRVERVAPGQLDAWIEQHPGWIAIVDIADAHRSGWRALGAVDGLNYARGMHVDLVVMEKCEESGE